MPPANPPPAEAPAVVPAPVVPAPGTQPEPTPPPTVVEPPTTFVTPNAPAVPGAIIPLIVMDDVPLTDAIKNLARQAGLNYMLDPKVTFGQVDPAHPGVTVQPNVTIRWENVTAEQALAALLNNYNLQLVEDPKSKIARVTVRDPAAPPPLEIKIIQLKYASPSNIISAVQSTLTDKRSKVVPDIRTSQLVVTATEQEQIAVDQLVERLDTRTKQVLIEARLLETSFNPKTAKGIDWRNTLEAQHITYGNGHMSGQSTTTIPGAPVTTTVTTPGGRTIETTTTPSKSVSTVLNSLLGDGGLSLNTASGLNAAFPGFAQKLAWYRRLADYVSGTRRSDSAIERKSARRVSLARKTSRK